MERDKIYFGFPVSFFNTETESELVKIIKREFPGYDVENPNQEHHQQGYQRYKEAGERGMDYFFKEVLPNMAGGVFLPFEDGMLGAGVYGEAEFLATAEKDIYEISLTGEVKRLDLDESRKLSIEETRERVYGKK